MRASRSQLDEHYTDEIFAEATTDIPEYAYLTVRKLTIPEIGKAVYVGYPAGVNLTVRDTHPLGKLVEDSKESIAQMDFEALKNWVHRVAWLMEDDPSKMI